MVVYASQAAFQRQGLVLTRLRAFDVTLWAQKLLSCMLPYLLLDHYACAVLGMASVTAAFYCWMKDRPHASQEGTALTALLMLGCVFVTQSYMLIHAAVASTPDHDAAPLAVLFNLTLTYIVICVARVCTRSRVALWRVTQRPAPSAQKHAGSLRTTQLNDAVSMEAYRSFVQGGMQKKKRGASSRAERVRSVQQNEP